MQKSIFIVLSIVSLVIALSMASAITVNSVDVSPIAPGKDGTLSMEIKNILNDDAEQVSLSLDFSNLPINAVGSTAESVDHINQDKKESFVYNIKASGSAKPGYYNVPYVIAYYINNIRQEVKGSVTVEVSGAPDLFFTVNQENQVIGQKGKFTVQITNKGTADAKFVNLKIFPSGYTLLSNDESYIGTISSDDFETTAFDVIYTGSLPTLTATVEYRDFDNAKITKIFNLPLTAYSTQKALELGIITKNYTFYYVIAVIVIIILWLVYRSIRKRRKLRKSMQTTRGN